LFVSFLEQVTWWFWHSSLCLWSSDSMPIFDVQPLSS